MSARIYIQTKYNSDVTRVYKVRVFIGRQSRPVLRTFAPKSYYGEIFFTSPLELVDKVLTPEMKKNGGHRLCFGENGSGKMP